MVCDVESKIVLDNMLIELLLSKMSGTLDLSEIKAGAFGALLEAFRKPET